MEKKFLTATELVMMKAIWDNKDKNVNPTGLISILRDDYNKECARTTVATFLGKLSDKGYIRLVRCGKCSYIEILKEEQEYVDEIMQNYVRVWFENDAVNAVKMLLKSRKITEEEKKEVVKLLEEKLEEGYSNSVF